MLLLTVDEDDFEKDEDKWNINFRKHTEKKNFYSSVRQYSTKQNKMQKEETKKIIEYNLLQVPGQILIIAFLNKFLKTLY